MSISRRRTLDQRFFEEEPKRILSIDGGGVRGILAAGILSEVERRLARRSGRGDFRLCEYFDLIGGTSTGAILAAGLAAGKTCAEAADLYREIAPDVFDPRGANAGLRKPRFDAAKLESALSRALGDYELGSPMWKTGLAIFTKRVDTGSAWTLTNNPRSAYWDGGPNGTAPNKRLMVRRLVQASAAAPSFFEETRIKLDQDSAGLNVEGVFVDGAIAGLNNPSVQLLKVATMKSFGFSWATGEDRLLMVSVGTGHWRPALDARSFAGFGLDDIFPAAARAVEALKTVIHDTSVSAIATMQGFSKPARPWRIDSELGEMRADSIAPFPLLAFQRLDARLDAECLRQLSFDLRDEDIERLRDMTAADVAHLDRLHEIGLRTGQHYFRNWPGEPQADWEALMLPPRFDPLFFSDRPLGEPKNRLDAMGRLFAPKRPVDD